MKVILFDDSTWDNLLPLTHTKPVSHVRIGAFKVIEKWERRMELPCIVQCKDYLLKKFGQEYSGEAIYVNSSVLPDEELVRKIKSLENNQGYRCGEKIVAYKGHFSEIEFTDLEGFSQLNHLWDIFLLNSQEINRDTELVDRKYKVGKWEGNFILGKGMIYAGENVAAQGVSFNTSEGPIIIGKNVTIMEGSLLRGPLAIGDGAVIKMGAKIYGGTTIGPKCTVGGEIKNSVFTAYSNKGHDGYIGNSVIGEWCNLGADTNCSNMKNTLGEIKVWSIGKNKMVNSHQIFCGVFMGDYVRTGISSRLNTGVVIDVACNVIQNDPVRKYLPAFSWGEMNNADLEKVQLSNVRLAELKKEVYSSDDQAILQHLYATLS
ncbi:MAG: putative sugar nucleotidyl transferase [Flavobacteriales bacterium]